MPNALISVYDKTGIENFARELVALGWTLYSSGGTAARISGASIPVHDVAELVGGGAILGHRVVTLSRQIHAGLLAQDTTEDRTELERLGIPWIDMVVGGLYPLEQAMADANNSLEDLIELTDIGGPTMFLSACKGRRITVFETSDRQVVLDWLKAGQPDRETMIRRLANKAKTLIARYILMSALYDDIEGYTAGLVGTLVSPCKYGENGWQVPAGLYSTGGNDPLALPNFHLVEGDAPSFNNWADGDRMLQTITHIAAAFDVNTGQVPLIAVAVKHGNACGAAVGDDPITVLQKAVSGDTRAIFGGLVMTNFTIDEEQAETLLAYRTSGVRRLLDGIIAPVFTENAVKMLQRKGDKCRFLVNPALAVLNRTSLDTAPRHRQVRGGLLKQTNYTYVLELGRESVELSTELRPEQLRDLLLGWSICHTSNSNTITLTRDSMLLGNGVGQQDRVGACELAIARATGPGAGHSVEGAVATSDSFFPFSDGPSTLVQAGVTVINTTSGSLRDKDTRRVCEESGVTLVMVPDREGRGFFGH